MDSCELKNICLKQIKTKLISPKLDLFAFNKKVLTSFDAFGLKFKNHLCINYFAGEFVNMTGDTNLKSLNDLKLLAKTNISLINMSGNEIKPINSYKNKTINNIKQNILDIHTYGTNIFLTLSIFRGRKNKNKDEVFCFSPRILNHYNKTNEYSMPIFDSKLKKLAKSFYYGAELAKVCHFDGIVIDASLQNLLGEMTSKEFNSRKLGYFMEYFEYLKFCIENVKKVGSKLPIVLKISPFSFLSEFFYKKDIKTLKGIRLGHETDIFDMLKLFVSLGIDGFMFEFGSFENQFLSEFAPTMGSDVYSKFYEEIEKFFNKNEIKNRFNEKPLIICSDNYGNFDLKLENDNKMFEITKEIYSDEKFIDKFYKNEAIKPCLRCGYCRWCSENNQRAECAINPQLFQPINREISSGINKIAVVGSGISGIVAATVLAERGYSVTLFEQNGEINKIGRLCEVFGFDKRLVGFNEYLKNKLFVFNGSGKVNINLNRKFNAECAKNYDAVVLATGFKELFLNISGAILKNVVSLFDLLDKKVAFENSKNIVILAESELALKTALYFAKNNKNISIIVENMTFINNMPDNLFSYYMITFEMLGVKIFCDAKIKVIHDDFVEIICKNFYGSKGHPFILFNVRAGKVYKKQPIALMVDCDLFIYDPKVISNNRLFYDCVVSNYSGKLFMIGDCLKISSLSDEIKSAYFVANNI